MKLIIIAFAVYLSLNIFKVQANDEWEQWKKKNHKEYPNARGLGAETQTDDDWEQWKKKNHKEYPNARAIEAESEAEIREEIFEETLQKIKDFNKKNSTFKMGLNEYSDLTIDELRRRFNVEFNIDNVRKNIKNANKSDISKGRIIYNTVNWVTSGYVAPVQNQGECGSCYTFSAITAIESAHAIKFGLKNAVKSFSAQQLVDCSYKKYKLDGTIGNYGCDGGYDYHTLFYVKKYGIQLASKYPYVGDLQACNYSSANVVTKITGISTASYDIGDVIAMKAVVSKQPLMVYIYVDDDFYSYSKGIYNGPNCENSKTSCPKGFNHAVTIVGYGNEDGIPFWMVKNSWGTSWGELGYFRIAMGNNTCCIEGFSYYPTL